MWFHLQTFDGACNFVAGYDCACLGGVLLGFDALLDRHGAPASHSWRERVLAVAFPTADPRAALATSPDGDTHAMGVLFDLISELDEIHAERDGWRELLAGRITPSSTRWAIAAKVPAEALERVRANLPRLLRGTGSKVVTGNGGFSALLVFGEDADEGESAATRLCRDIGAPVYLLDFDDDAPFVKELAKGRERRKRGHPADFLEARGIVAPGYAPEPSSLVSVGVVEDLTVEQAHKSVPELPASAFRSHPRGTLVVGADGFAIMTLAMRAKRRGYIVDVDRKDGSFACEIVELGPSVKQFAPTAPSVNFPQVDSVLGETTLDGILRVLEIPRELLP